MKKVYVTHLPIQKAFTETMSKEKIEFSFYEKSLPCPREILINESKKVEALVTSLEDKLDRDFLKANQHLKVVANNAVGFNNIDIQAAKKYGIKVGNTPDVLTEATAELALALTLNVARNVHQANHFIHNGDWKGWDPKGFLGISLQGRKVGIIGAGRIGFSYAKKMKQAFSCSILYHSRSYHPEFESFLNAKKIPLEDIFKESDIVSIHCPLTESTKNLVDKRLLSLMKKDALIINTARGEVVHQGDLIEHLRKNKIFGAGLDVMTPEPLSSESPLLGLKNVLLTPHIGSATFQARYEMTKIAIKNVLAGLNNQNLPCEVC